MPLWTLLTLINILANGTAIALFKKLTSEKIASAHIIIANSLVTAIILFPLFLVDLANGRLNSLEVSSILYVLAALVVGAAGNLIYLKAIAKNELSVLGPFENLRPLFAIILSIPILRELPTPRLLIGASLIVGGALILSLKRRQKKINRQNPEATVLMVVAAALFALLGIIDKLALASFPTFAYAFIIVVSFTIAFTLFGHTHTIPLKLLTKPSMISTGVLTSLGAIAIYSALKLASPSHVISLQMLRSFYLALLGFLWFNEKDIQKKILAGSVMVAGAVLIVWQ